MINASNTSQFNIARQSYMANANQSVMRPGTDKDDKKEADKAVKASEQQAAKISGNMPKQEVKSPVVVKAAPEKIQAKPSEASSQASEVKTDTNKVESKPVKSDVEPIKVEISDAGKQASKNTKISEKNSIVSNNDGLVKRADESKTNRISDNKEAAAKPIERRERIMENIDLEVEAQADRKADVKEIVAQQNETSEAHCSEVKAMVEESMAESKERVADAIESAKEANESKGEGPQVLSMSGMTASQMQTLYAQGRISFNDYQEKVDARKEELQERIDANNETQRIVVGLDMISRGFDGTEAKDLIAS